MAMILDGMDCECQICGRVIDQQLLDNDEFVATTHFISDENSPLWPYSDAVMHCECFLAWPLRSQFVAAYNEAMRDVISGEGFHSHMQDDGQLISIDENGVIDHRTEEEFAADFNRYLEEQAALFLSQQPPPSLPSNVETRLRRGKPVASQVFCEREGWQAWVWVNPVMRSGKTWAQVQQERTRTRQATPYDDSIARYQIRYVELSDWHLSDEWLLDLDIAIQERPIVDRNWEVEDVESLIRILREHSCNPSRLRSPSKANYPAPPLMASTPNGEEH